MRLSILICSLENRAAMLQSLLNSLQPQLTDEVEVLVEVDNKQITTGAKRQKLLHRACGEYIVFIDDDDRVDSEYVKLILDAVKTNPDCVATCGYYQADNGPRQLWKLSKDYDNVDRGGILYRTTNHISPVKRRLALSVGFPDKSNAEDKWYSDRLKPLLVTEARIDKPIYYYDFKSKNKEYK